MAWSGWITRAHDCIENKQVPTNGIRKMGKTADSNQPMKMMLSAEYFTCGILARRLYIPQRRIKLAHKTVNVQLPGNIWLILCKEEKRYAHECVSIIIYLPITIWIFGHVIVYRVISYLISAFEIWSRNRVPCYQLLNICI